MSAWRRIGRRGEMGRQNPEVKNFCALGISNKASLKIKGVSGAGGAFFSNRELNGGLEGSRGPSGLKKREKGELNE